MKLRLALTLVLLTACGGAKESPSIAPEENAPTTSENPSPAGDTPSPGAADAGSDAAPSTPPPDIDAATPPSDPDPLAGMASVVKVQDGFGYLEGPVWRAALGELLFSDMTNDAIVRFDAPSSFSTFRAPSSKSNGLAVDAKGQLVACEGASRRVTRTKSNGSIEVLADHYQGYRFNAPNDVIVRSDGTVYFTDPDYTVAGPKELWFQGVYRIEPDKTLSLVADDMDKPNGIALSPDESTLYVSDEAAGFLRAYDLAPNGIASNARKIAEVPNADGFAVDDRGNLYVSSTHEIVVLRPDGTVRGTIPMPKQPSNCTFGGTDRKTLFIAAQDTLFKIDLAIPGKP